MTEQQICEFVGKWNCELEDEVFEDFVEPGPFLSQPGNYMLAMLDDLMALHDADAPKWVDAWATAPDGTVYWARVDANKVKQIPERPDALGLAQAMAQERAEYLAQCRCKDSR